VSFDNENTPENGAVKRRNASSSAVEVIMRNKSVAKKLVLQKYITRNVLLNGFHHFLRLKSYFLASRLQPFISYLL
jgi:hypothetical protein